MLTVMTQGKSFRTRSLDTLARRLFGAKAGVIVMTEENGTVLGRFATPDRRDANLWRTKAEFLAEAKTEKD